MIKEVNKIFSGKQIHTDPVPWNIKEILKFLLFCLLYSVSVGFVFFGASIGLSYHSIPVIRNYSPFLVVYPIMNIITAFVIFFILKSLILNKYDNGMKILIESRNNLSFFIIAIILGSCMEFPIFLLYDYEIRRGALAMPLFPFLLYSINAILFSPIIEEILYRSFIYRAFKKKIGIIASIFITTIIFTSTHWQQYFHLELLIQTFVFGLVINLFYEKTGSLYGCILTHSVCNIVYIITVKYFPI